MSLFNTMFIQYLLRTDLKVNSTLKFIQILQDHDLPRLQTNYNISYKQYSFAVLLISQNNSSIDINDRFSKLNKSKLISPNFAMSLINKYWQETIFLSRSDTISDKYINQLNSGGIAVYKKQYKKFLLDFSKALITGRIQSSLDNIKDLSLLSNSKDIQYIWRKSINFSFPKTFPNFILNKRGTNFPNRSQVLLIEKLKNNQLPIFTITNNFNQIIIAEPSDELINNKNFLDKMYKWYDDNFLWKKDEKPIYESLFFVNPEDALEYKNYMRYKYFEKNNSHPLNIFASSFDFYYSLVRTSPPRVQFRLIPDLKEVGELIYKYQFNKNVFFHKKQKKGNDYFQGQPIYLIQPIIARNKKTKKIEELNYYYELNQDIKKQKHEAVFTNYKVLLIAWRKFLKQNSNYILPKQPKILVYNLEDFLKLYEKNDEINKLNILFIPNQESYEFIKINNMNKSQYRISKIFLNNLLSLKTISHRIIWSLTSRQPMKW